MKRIKKISSAIAALALAATMAVPAAMNSFAADTSTTTIKIMKDSENVNAESDFVAYRLLNVSVDMNSTDKKSWVYNYTVNQEYSEILQGIVGSLEKEAEVDDDYVVKYISSLKAPADLRSFADKVYRAVAAAGKEPEEAADKGVFSNIPQGYYLIAETKMTGDTVSLVMLDTADEENVTVTQKKEGPTFTKKIKETNDSDPKAGEWKDVADNDIGDDVEFKLSATLPQDFESYTDGYKLIFHDDLQSVLEFNPDSVMITYGDATKSIDDWNNGVDAKYQIALNTTPECGWNKTPTGHGDGCDFEIKIPNVAEVFKDAAAGGTIDITYSALLKDDAKIGSEGNWNTGKLSYSNNPYWNADGKHDSDDDNTTTDSEEDAVVTFTYELDVNKVRKAQDGETGNQPLEGAEFTLYKWVLKDGSETEFEWKAIKSNIAGAGDNKNEFKFAGLDTGKYKLEESKVPSGYNKADDIEFEIKAVYDEKGQTITDLGVYDPSGNLLSTGEANAEFTADISGGIIETDVLNLTGTKLPSTGGIGTTIFYVGGGAIVAVAGILLITKKRMDKSEEE